MVTKHSCATGLGCFSGGVGHVEVAVEKAIVKESPEEPGNT